MINPTYQELKRAVRAKDYVWFGNRPYDLNVIGIRNPERTSGQFDDTLCIAYIDANGRERVFACPFTTDPGPYYLQRTLTSKGCAILKLGQYRGAYQIGSHRNYTALRQIRPVTVFRDNNKNTELDWDRVPTETGMFAINIHRNLADGIAKEVGQYSAGCQVIQSSDDFAYVMSLVRRQKLVIGTDIVSYTLLEEPDL